MLPELRVEGLHSLLGWDVGLPKWTVASTRRPNCGVVEGAVQQG